MFKRFKKYPGFAIITALFVLSGFGLKLQALGSNLVANESVETVNTANTALPVGWVKDKWGTNTSTFSYGTDAHTGTKGLSVSITQRTSGDAKWYFNPITVKPSTTYTFSDYSKSNIASSIVAMYTSTTGAITYVTLASSVAAHSTWFEKSITFTTPANVKTMTVFHLINKVGSLQTDDFSLAETNANVTMPTVSLTGPADNATVSGTINLTATASNATSVQFKVDGVNVGPAQTANPYTYAWDSTSVANGTHTIAVVATNAAGTATGTANVSVSNAAPAPTVTLSAPANNATVSGSTTFNATATDALGVQFQVDGVNVGSEDTTSPYAYVWDSTSVADGTHTVSAIARGASSSVTSSSATISVNNVVPAPTAVITAPANNGSVSGTTTLGATATNTLGVQFKVDGVNVGPEDTTSPYSASWDTTSLANGTHTVTAVARGSSTNTTATATVSVNNVAPAPTVSISAPAANSTVSGQVSITAATTNTVGVQFKIDGVNVGSEDTTSPYSFNWDTTAATNANHTLTAVARNSTGQLVTSSAVTVTVYNAPAPIVTNLVANPSVETADAVNPQLPASWANNKWGTNTAIFTYPVTGHTGSDATRVEITSYTSGDAKWYFAAVPATASTTYQFSDWYQSNVTTSVVVELQNASGVRSYLDLGTVAPSTTWAQTNLTFTTKADTTAFTVYHLMNRTGYLETDDTSVTKIVPPVPDSNPIANSSLETANGTSPTAWTSSSWGTNNAAFQYMSEGHTGTKSVKTTITSYTNGDAKWFYNPITTLEKGKQYRWTTWYKTNTHPQAVMMYTRADGTEGFFGMPQPFPAADSSTVWHQYTETFIVPQDAGSVSNFLFINGNGWVQVDDNSLTDYQPTGWNRPLVSLTFDDGHEENVANALPVMNQYGIKSTQCYNTTDLKLMADGGRATMNAFTSTGHEICSHTSTHPFLTKLTSGQLTSELADSKAYLEATSGKPVTTFASPYGDYNEVVNNEIKKYYVSHRTVDEGYNSKDNYDVYRLRVQNMTPTTTLAQYNGWLAQAKATNTWLILVYHDVVPTNPTPYGSYTSDFKLQMAALNASGLTVKTYQDALTELSAQ